MFLSKTKHLTKYAIALFVSVALSSYSSIILKNPSSEWETLFDGKNLNKWETVKDNGDPLRGWEIKDGTCSVKDHINGYDIVTKETNLVRWNGMGSNTRSLTILITPT